MDLEDKAEIEQIKFTLINIEDLLEEIRDLLKDSKDSKKA